MNHSKHATLLALAVCALSALAPGAAHAACADADKYPFLSKEYVFDKTECALDKALDTGQDMLVEAGKNLLQSAISSYLPGLGSMIFGGGEDPFAAHAQRILESIDAARFAIISEIVDQARMADDANMMAIQTTIQGFMGLPYAYKLQSMNDLDFAIQELQKLRGRLENRNYDVWNLHAYVTLVDLLLTCHAERIALQKSQIDWGDATEAEVADDTAQAIYSQWNAVLNGGAATGAFSYISSLSPARFRTASDARFGSASYTGHSLRSTNPACTSFQAGIKKYDVADRSGSLQATKRKYGVAVFFRGKGTLEPPPPHGGGSPVCTGSTGDLFGYLLTGTALTNHSLSQSESTLAANAVESMYLGAATIQVTLNPHNPPTYTVLASTPANKLITHQKNLEYSRYIMAGYGTLRPILDRWWHDVGNGGVYAHALDSAIDAQLNQSSGFAWTLLALPSVLRDPQGLTPTVERYARNYALGRGWQQMNRVVYAPHNDPAAMELGGIFARQLADYFRRLVPPELPEKEMANMYVAKVGNAARAHVY